MKAKNEKCSDKEQIKNLQQVDFDLFLNLKACMSIKKDVKIKTGGELKFYYVTSKIISIGRDNLDKKFLRLENEIHSTVATNGIILYRNVTPEDLYSDFYGIFFLANRNKEILPVFMRHTPNFMCNWWCGNQSIEIADDKIKGVAVAYVKAKSLFGNS